MRKFNQSLSLSADRLNDKSYSECSYMNIVSMHNMHGVYAYYAGAPPHNMHTPYAYYAGG